MSTTKLSTRKAPSKKSTGRVKPIAKPSEASWLDSTESKTWENWQLLSEHWHADLKFFEDEIRFLHNLISKYFMWLMEEKNIGMTRRIAKGLSELEVKRQKLEQDVVLHQQHYRSLIENPFAQDSRKFKNEHAKLESNVADFVTRFKALKRETFELTEQVLESEKVKHLLIKDNQINSYH
jgi:hypothetical protein